MKWYLLLQFVMITPHPTDVIIASEWKFPNQALCEEARAGITPSGLDKLVKELVGFTVGSNFTYRDAHVDCKEHEDGNPV